MKQRNQVRPSMVSIAFENGTLMNLLVKIVFHDYLYVKNQSVSACVDNQGRSCSRVQRSNGTFKLVPVQDVVKSLRNDRSRRNSKDDHLLTFLLE